VLRIHLVVKVLVSQAALEDHMDSPAMMLETKK